MPTGKVSGQVAKELAPTGLDRNFLQNYYVVKITTKLPESSFDTLDGQADVIDITPGGKILDNKTELEALGIDLSLAVTERDAEYELFEWLLDVSSKDINSVFMGR